MIGELERQVHDLLEHEEAPAPRTCTICRDIELHKELKALLAEQDNCIVTFARADGSLGRKIQKLQRRLAPERVR